jgi:hypothetical protein
MTNFFILDTLLLNHIIQELMGALWKGKIHNFSAIYYYYFEIVLIQCTWLAHILTEKYWK